MDHEHLGCSLSLFKARPFPVIYLQLRIVRTRAVLKWYTWCVCDDSRVDRAPPFHLQIKKKSCNQSGYRKHTCVVAW